MGKLCFTQYKNLLKQTWMLLTFFMCFKFYTFHCCTFHCHINRKVFWCFQVGEKGCIGNKWVKKVRLAEITNAECPENQSIEINSVCSSNFDIKELDLSGFDKDKLETILIIMPELEIKTWVMWRHSILGLSKWNFQIVRWVARKRHNRTQW